MIITTVEYSFKAGEKAIKFENIYYIKRDIGVKSIDKKIIDIIKLINNDEFYENLIMDLIVEGVTFELVYKCIKSWKAKVIPGKSDIEIMKFRSQVREVYRKLEHEKNNKALDKFRGTFFEKIIENKVNKKYGKCITGVAVPVQNKLYRNYDMNELKREGIENFIKCEEKYCKIKNDTRKTVDLLYKSSNKVNIMEAKVSPSSFSCFTLETLLKIKKAILEKGISYGIDAICIVPQNKFKIMLQINEAISQCKDKECFDSFEIGDFVLKDLKDYKVD